LDISTDIAFDTYTVYRSVNNGTYEKTAFDVRSNTFTDKETTNNNFKYFVTAKDRSFNESLKSNIVFVNKTLATENIEISNFKMYPNPTKSAIYFSFDKSIPDNGIIEIYDLKGVLVSRTYIESAQTKIDLDNEKGLFIAKITFDNYFFVRKFIKQ
tara:strand:+ start:253 stop:720 length:468 start_codon:yes stop_codon:yes gene_type:complete